MMLTANSTIRQDPVTTAPAAIGPRRRWRPAGVRWSWQGRHSGRYLPGAVDSKRCEINHRRIS
jgi:hypothetical protein